MGVYQLHTSQFLPTSLEEAWAFRIANRLIIRKKLREIFQYRERALDKIFPFRIFAPENQ